MEYAAEAPAKVPWPPTPRWSGRPAGRAAVAVSLIGLLVSCGSGTEPEPTAELYIDTDVGKADVGIADGRAGHFVQFVQPQLQLVGTGRSSVGDFGIVKDELVLAVAWCISLTEVVAGLGLTARIRGSLCVVTCLLFLFLGGCIVNNKSRGRPLRSFLQSQIIFHATRIVQVHVNQS